MSLSRGQRGKLMARPIPRIFAFLFILFAVGMLPPKGWAADLKFIDQDLDGHNFVGQMLDGADFSGASLHGTRFNQASLRGAIFDGADLRLARFTEADLTGADLRKSAMAFSSEGTNFTNANLEGLNFDGARWLNNNFRGANLRGTTGIISCTNCNFRGADLRGANLSGWEAPGAGQEGVFSGAIYDETTHWPSWLNVEKSGARRPR